MKFTGKELFNISESLLKLCENFNNGVRAQGLFSKNIMETITKPIDKIPNNYIFKHFIFYIATLKFYGMILLYDKIYTKYMVKDNVNKKDKENEYMSGVLDLLMALAFEYNVIMLLFKEISIDIENDNDFLEENNDELTVMLLKETIELKYSNKSVTKLFNGKPYRNAKQIIFSDKFRFTVLIYSKINMISKYLDECIRQELSFNFNKKPILYKDFKKNWHENIVKYEFSAISNMVEEYTKKIDIPEIEALLFTNDISVENVDAYNKYANHINTFVNSELDYTGCLTFHVTHLIQDTKYYNKLLNQ